MKSRANNYNSDQGFLQQQQEQQQPIHATEMLEFFDDLGVFADLDIEAESAAAGSAGASVYLDASPPATGRNDTCALQGESTTTTPAPQFQSFNALLDAELQLADDFDVGGLGPMEPLLPMHLHEINEFGSMSNMAADASSSLALEHELFYFTSDYDSDPASPIASELAPAETEDVARPKKKKKSTSQRQKEELSYLRGKLFEYENELKRIAIENAKNGVAAVAAAGATNGTGANGEVEGALTACVKALSLWETMAKNQLEEKNRAEMENAALREKMEAQLKFAKSLERMLRKRRIWDDIQEPTQQRFITMLVKDSESFDSLRNGVEARVRTVDDVFHAQGLTKLSPPKRNANIVFVNEGGIRIDFIRSTAMPFEGDVVSNIAWEYLQKRELKLSEVKLTTQVVEQSEDFIITTQSVTSNIPSDIRSTTVHSAFKRIRQDHRIVFVWESIAECKASATRGTPAAQLFTKGCGQIIHQVDPHGGSKSAILQSYATVVATLGQPEGSSGLSQSHDDTPRSLDTGLLTELTISAYEQSAQTAQQAIENALFDNLLRSA